MGKGNKINVFLLISVCVVVIITAQQELIDEFLDFPLSCISDDDCNDVNHSVCDVLPPDDVTNTTEPEIKQCRCDVDEDWHRDGDDCYQHSGLGEICDDDITICVDTHSICDTYAPTPGQHRCQCDKQRGYIAIVDDDTWMCAKELTRYLDPSCEECVGNEGFCYDTDEDNEKDGCLCVASRSGDNCQNLHVTVNCNVTDMTMNICYTSHSWINFDARAAMIAGGQNTYPECKAVPSGTGRANCPAGTQSLSLSMKENELTRCGTKFFTSGIDKFRYENTITVYSNPPQTGPKDLIFKTFCEFDTHAEMKALPAGVLGINGNHRGEYLKPSISLQILTHYGEEVAEGVWLMLGDMVYARITLTLDGTYKALRVVSCQLSNKYNLVDNEAIIYPLISNGCPVEGQDIIDVNNNWEALQGGYQLQMGKFRIIKFRDSDAVFLHCRVKTCLDGFEDDCAMPECSVDDSPEASEDDSAEDESSGGGENSVDESAENPDASSTETRKRRKKRAMNNVQTSSGERQVDITAEFIVYDQSPAAGVGLTGGELAGVVCALLILLVVFVVISGMLYWNMRRSTPKDNSDFRLTPRPPKFALSRIIPNQHI